MFIRQERGVLSWSSLHLELIGRTDRTEKSQRGSFMMAPMGSQSTRRRDCETRSNVQSPQTSPLIRGTGTSSGANWIAAQMRGDIRNHICVVLLVQSCLSTWPVDAVSCFRALEAVGAHHRLALMMFFIVCSVVGAPLSWHKTNGGDTVVWVGLELLHRTRHLGISLRRGEWFTKWARETADSQYIHMARLEEGLGRVMFVARALELERPFLGPLYKFMALHPRQSTRRVPAYVSFILHYLADQVAQSRHYNCSETQEAPRVDAQSSNTRTGIGGLFPRRNSNGSVDLSISPWFSTEMMEQEWPWIHTKENKAALKISTLEALAVLVALKLQFGGTPGEGRNRVKIAPTDNRGNGSALNKLMTTKFTASALLMELSCYMKNMSFRTVVEWAPREANKEADSLANGVFDGFLLCGFRPMPAASSGRSRRKRGSLGERRRSASEMPN